MLKQTAFSILLSALAALNLASCGSRPEAISPEKKHLLTTAPYHILVTYSSECPFCIRYTHSLKQIRQKMPKHWNFKFIKVISDETWDFDWHVPLSGEIWNDSLQEWTHLCGFSVYPEVAILDSLGNLLYKGAIDDRAVETGLNKQTLTQAYLSQAMNDIQAGKRPKISLTQAKGCFIETHE